MKISTYPMAAVLLLAACRGGGGDSNNGGGTTQAMTQQGIVEGTLDNGLRIFSGVRYAAPPVGDLRFKPPAEPEFVAGVTDAKVQQQRCIQPLITGSSSVVGQEDCLFLNIWAPDDEQTHPVMVFLHGGTFNPPTADGARFAAKTGSVVVTLNRREGVMGYLALQALIDESENRTAGNYGALDVIAALKWVQRNIAEFGGDPQRVMLVGMSLGASLMCHMFAAPDAKGLFQSAALLSGNCRTRFVLDGSSTESTLFPPLLQLHEPILNASGCGSSANTLQCLRSMDAAALVQAARAVPGVGPANANVFIFNIDGVVVVTNPYDALKNQVAGSFPLIVGTTRDEIRFFAPTPVPDDAAYRNRLNDFFGSAANQLYDLYPTAAYPSAAEAAYTLFTDAMFSCVAEEIADAASTNRPVYLYHRTRGLNPDDIAAHGVDVAFLFNTFDKVGLVPDRAALDISSAMQSGWSELAARPELEPMLDAGLSGRFVWPAYEAYAVQVVQFGDPVVVVNQHRDGRCDALWNILAP